MKWVFMTANYVAREAIAAGLATEGDWGACHRATVDAFHGPRFAEKFSELMATVSQLGFNAAELWVAHLDPLLATPAMVAEARAIAGRNGVEIVAYTAGFGTPGIPREDAVRIFETARGLGASMLTQAFHPANGELVKELAAHYGIRMAHENHPEKSAAEVVAKVAPFAPFVGAALDTGWFATHGYSPVQAVHDLGEHLMHVHLKDIRAEGAHDTCALGDGIVDIPGVLRALRAVSYSGHITIEHEPMDADPTEDVRVSLARTREWFQ